MITVKDPEGTVVDACRWFVAVTWHRNTLPTAFCGGVNVLGAVDETPDVTGSHAF